MRVKGTLILDYVRIIRANKGLDWGDYLEAEDWEIINGQILSSQWYPYDSFHRIAYAVFKIIAHSDLQTARTFGRFVIKGLLNIYKTILVPGDPAASVKKLAALRRTFIDGGGETRVDDFGDGWLVYEFVMPGDQGDDEAIKAFTYQVAGNLEELVEQAGGRHVVVEVETGMESNSIRAKWE